MITHPKFSVVCSVLLLSVIGFLFQNCSQPNLQLTAQQASVNAPTGESK